MGLLAARLVVTTAAAFDLALVTWAVLEKACMRLKARFE
jgi:hypothetical protein